MHTYAYGDSTLNMWFKNELHEFLSVWFMFGMLIFWIVVMMPLAVLVQIYFYLDTKGTMITRPKLTLEERKELI